MQKIIDCKGELLLSVKGTSMLPTIYPDTKISVVKAEGNVVVGEIVVFSHSGYEHIIVHRVYKKKVINGDAKLITKGDSAFTPDKPISLDKIIGKVGEIRTNKGNIKPNVKIWRFIMPTQVFLGKIQYFLPKNVRRYLKRKLASLYSLLLSHTHTPDCK